MVKIGPLDPQFQKFILKNKLTQAKHIARGVCMPRGLNYTSTECNVRNFIIHVSAIIGINRTLIFLQITFKTMARLLYEYFNLSWFYAAIWHPLIIFFRHCSDCVSQNACSTKSRC